MEQGHARLCSASGQARRSFGEVARCMVTFSNGIADSCHAGFGRVALSIGTVLQCDVSVKSSPVPCSIAVFSKATVQCSLVMFRGVLLCSA